MHGEGVAGVELRGTSNEPPESRRLRARYRSTPATRQASPCELAIEDDMLEQIFDMACCNGWGGHRRAWVSVTIPLLQRIKYDVSFMPCNQARLFAHVQN